MKVKTILVSQPEPKVENSPYFELQEKQKVKNFALNFKSFGYKLRNIAFMIVNLSNYS